MVKFNENAIRILEKRYLLKEEVTVGEELVESVDEDNNKIWIKQDKKELRIKETPDELLLRVANVVCKDNEVLKNKVLEMMNDLRFLPNTPTLMNAGTTNMLSACFVIDVDDTLESIVHDAGWQQAYIHKMGGGVGINFSKLRPKGDLIKRTGGITSGVLGFLEVFNTLSEVIRQGGKRDGANMGLLSISHPEIEDWINAKVGDNKYKYRNFNLSVLVTDDFMNAVEKDLDWNLIFNGKIYKTIKAKYLFDMICKSTWECGCPGIVFVDEINRWNPLADKGMKIECTNPCGEIPGYVGMYNGEFIAESCNLGSLNLSKYCYLDDRHLGYYIFNFNLFNEDIRNATEFLDMVIDANEYPFDFIDKGTKLTRKIGLGITGLSECLIKLGMPYGSNESLKFIEDIICKLRDASHKKSEELGKEKGYYPLADVTGIYRRNLATTCIAPTGTIGRLMLGHPYAGGIEPPPAIDMSSYIIDSKVIDGIHPLLVDMLNRYCGSKCFDVIINQIKHNGKSIQHIKEIPDDIKKLFLVAEEIPIETHIKVQSLVQQYTDNAVSKTINMKHDSAIDDVKKAFTLAWKSKCKGVTVYRNNSKDKQVFESNVLSLNNAPIPRPRYKDHICVMREIETACGIYYNGITWDLFGMAEDFPVNSGKGGCVASQEVIGRSVSTMFRNNLSPEVIMKQFHKVKCNSCLTADKFYDENNKFIGILSCADGISQQIRDYYGTDIEKDIINLQKKIHEKFNLTSKVNDNLTNDFKEIDIKETDVKVINIKEYDKNINNELKKCPDCGSMTIRQEGCMNDACPNCGWGGCS